MFPGGGARPPETCSAAYLYRLTKPALSTKPYNKNSVTHGPRRALAELSPLAQEALVVLSTCLYWDAARTNWHGLFVALARVMLLRTSEERYRRMPKALGVGTKNKSGSAERELPTPNVSPNASLS